MYYYYYYMSFLRENKIAVIMLSTLSPLDLTQYRWLCTSLNDRTDLI